MIILLAIGLTGVTVIIHAFGTLQAVAHLSRIRQRRLAKARLFVPECHVVFIVVVLLILHLLEAAVWATYYRLADLLPDMPTAMYFSLTSYTTVGYGDIVLPSSRFLGPTEAGVGILMFGWSTGIIVTTITRIYGSRLQVDHDTGRESTTA